MMTQQLGRRPPEPQWDQFLRQRSPAISILLGVLALIPVIPGQLRAACAMSAVGLMGFCVHLRKQRNVAIAHSQESDQQLVASAQEAERQRIAELQESERQRVAAEEDALARESAAVELDVFARGGNAELPNLNHEVAGVLLHPDERCVALSSNVVHIVLRRRRRSDMGESYTEEWAEASDRGSLYVTNKRIIFAGGREVLTVPTHRVGSVQTGKDRVHILAENRTHPLMLVISEPYRAPVLAAACMCVAKMALIRENTSNGTKRS